MYNKFKKRKFIKKFSIVFKLFSHCFLLGDVNTLLRSFGNIREVFNTPNLLTYIYYIKDCFCINLYFSCYCFKSG